MADEQLELGDDDRSIALKRAWGRALLLLASKVNKVTFESYIRPIRPLSYRQQCITLGVASAFAREWLDKKYGHQIRSILEGILGSPLEIRFSVINAEERPLIYETLEETANETPEATAAPSPKAAASLFDDAPPPGSASPTPPPSRTKRRDATRSAAAPSGERALESSEPPLDISLPFNEKYTFDNYIIGRSNRMAQAGAAAVAMAPGAAYNPLFIYGGSGLGKTHLMHAIGNAIRQRNGATRVALIDGENFTYHFVSALRERRTDDFRRYYRNVDVWLVDDIQFIAGREQTKEEFFHTFNALYQMGKQIVIASDCSPRELRTMDERLRSRFESGLIADIGAPELETRIAILESRCRQEGYPVPQEVLVYIASAIQSNIRTLEGALTRLIAYHSIMRAPISVEMAQNVLVEFFIDKAPPSQPSHKGVTIETVMKAVAQRYDTDIDALRSQRRDRDISTARQVAMYLCRELTENSLIEIGAAIGGRDHSTVLRAIKKVEAQLFYDPSVQKIVKEIRQKLDN
jgi:chromosomal replication initiator protein